jgi:uncharacterized membrane protein HdeD (DUF308 family)
MYLFRCHLQGETDLQQIANFRTMILFRGIAAILFGIVTLAWPGLTIITFTFLFGVYAIVNGITTIAASLRNREEGWFLLLVEGILSILAGLIALVWPGTATFAFIYLLAAWAIVTGIIELLAPLSFPMNGGRALLMVLAGLVSIVFGIVIAGQPVSGALAVTWLIGAYAIVFGIMYIVVYFQARSLAASLA